MLGIFIIGACLGLIVGLMLPPTPVKRIIFVDTDAVNKETIPEGFIVVAVHCGPNKNVVDCVLEVR